MTTHYRLAKHQTGWRLTGNPERDLHWTSPTGRHYTTTPTQHPTDHTRNTHTTSSSTTIPSTNSRSTNTDPDPPPPF